jgi:MoaA/NifB/PqqE/SkfB family radical SAM enzyme
MSNHRYRLETVVNDEGWVTLHVDRDGEHHLSVHLQYYIPDRWDFKSYFFKNPKLRKLRIMRALNMVLDDCWYNGISHPSPEANNVCN